ncbi:MAG TPA: hypothetical protein PLC52_05005 [Anaerolineales bacterium]|nr:hypothetical protein [Anaerolineales bacterium]HRQ92208.1 hypothetical protein [Anaerolineales bacterium]
MSDPDYKTLFLSALAKNVDNPKWKDGDFVAIKTVSNTKVGSVGLDFIEGLVIIFQFRAVFP